MSERSHRGALRPIGQMASDRRADEREPPPGRQRNWTSWLLGAALLAGVVTAALHLTEARALGRLLEEAEPRWLLLALLLQALTYLAQAEVFGSVPRAAGSPAPRSWLLRLSLGKLFLDQAVPSAGMSSALLAVKALEGRGFPRDVAAAAAVVNVTSYHAAYALALGAALALAAGRGSLGAPLLLVSLLFLAFSLGVVAVGILLTGPPSRPGTRLASFPLLRRAVAFLATADFRLCRSRRVLGEALGFQVVIFLADAATMWVVLRSLGLSPPTAGVFVSFMVSSLLRTVGVVPGGLGTFEAASVATLHAAGVALEAALAGTLLFRGLSFWLPMLPGPRATRRLLAPPRPPGSLPPGEEYWALDSPRLIRLLDASIQGLTREEAAARLEIFGRNRIGGGTARTRTRVLLEQVRSPLLLLLVFAALVSGLTGEWLDASIVLLIVLASVGLGFSREWNAHSAVAALQARIRMTARVLRDGQPTPVSVEEVVPGDVIELGAGALVPADALLLQATDLFVGEAALTGESFPVEKKPGVVASMAPVRGRSNCVFLGTNVRSGTARALVARTGAATEFGKVAGRLAREPPETEFDRGLRRFGALLTISMLVLVIVVFVAHVLRGRPPVETLLFSVALAVGLSPELLPAILSVNLARSARLMAGHGVIVRRLHAIENLGSMDVLCTDKTGTLTEGVVKVAGAYGPDAEPSPEVLELGACNAALETGYRNPLDEAILNARTPDLSRLRKRAEIPFDFVRKRVSVVVEHGRGVRLITKGAFEHVLEVSTRAPDGRILDAAAREDLRARHNAWTRQGIRVLAVATREVAPQPRYDREDERGLTFAGFLTFLDRPKEGVEQTLAELSALGVRVKLITGDSRLVAQAVAGMVGLPAKRVLTGADMIGLHGPALTHAADRTDLFVEVDPEQKERIILALKRAGHVVAFLGDGVNDAPAMHTADTSLCVDQAVDVAREAADFVLLERDLQVIKSGIEAGRRTFANTLKYVLTTMSANLGNMVSMAAASLFLPFLPLLAGQVLLNNFLSDIPALGLADDNVDPELVARGERWNMRFIGRFMGEFGLLSSVFDLLTFGVLFLGFAASAAAFRTAWFVESLLTELVIALVVRTRRPLLASRPGNLLLAATAALVPVTLAIPYLPLVGFLGFVPLPLSVLGTLLGITVLYVASAEALKRWFFRSGGWGLTP